MAGLNRGPQTFQRAPKKRKMSVRRCHWQARKRDIIFMLSPRVSTAGYRHTRESEKGKKESGNKGVAISSRGPVRVLSANIAIAASRSLLSLPREQQYTEFSRYLCTPEPSHRKTIESNREESDGAALFSSRAFSLINSTRNDNRKVRFGHE